MKSFSFEKIQPNMPELNINIIQGIERNGSISHLYITIKRLNLYMLQMVQLHIICLILKILRSIREMYCL